MSDITCDLPSLVSRMAAGDQCAFAALYRETSARVYGLARWILGNDQLAEEVTEDTYFQAWKDASHFNPASGDVWAWLLMRVRSRALDRLRFERPRTFPPLNEEVRALIAGSAIEGAPEEHERDAEVRSALQRLPAHQAEAIIVAFFRGVSYAEAARLLDTPEGTLKSRIRAGLAALRRELSKSMTRWEP